MTIHRYGAIMTNSGKQKEGYALTQAKDNQFSKDFGEFILHGRLKKGLTQTELAEKLGLSQSYYAYIENGKRNVFLDLAMRICNCLDLSLEEFVTLQYGDSMDKTGDLSVQPSAGDAYDSGSEDPEQFRLDEY